MNDETYLLNLTLRLAHAIAGLPDAVRHRQRDYLAGRQNPDGGFSGREGGSDLYYTGFGLRGLAVLDALTPDVCARAAGYLRQCLTTQTSIVDFFSFLYAGALVQAGGGPDVLADSPPGWPDRVAELLESFRTADGGYGKSTDAASGSTYHTFLVGLCYQLLGRSLPRGPEAARFMATRRREDGGYVEIAPQRRGGTNPTAAAAGLLQMEESKPGELLTDELRAGVIAFLVDMVSSEGGLRANGRAPLADLLSTFTGLWTLQQLGGLEQIDRQAAHAFAAALEVPTGGFRGGLWDEHCDVEYTFYGLGCLGLLR